MFLCITFVGALAISGCSSDHSNERDKLSQQSKISDTTKPMHKEVGEA